MSIIEATKLAMESGKYMTRTTEDHFRECARVAPAEEDLWFVLYLDKGEEEKNTPRQRWCPQIRDVLMDDWVVVDGWSRA